MTMNNPVDLMARCEALMAELARMKASRFTPPTLEQAQAYCAAINMDTAEAQRFMDHHEARGWMLGRVKMKNWQAAMRTWKSNAERFAPRQVAKPANDGQRKFWLGKQLEAVETELRELDRQAYEISGLNEKERARRKELRTQKENIKREIGL